MRAGDRARAPRGPQGGIAPCGPLRVSRRLRACGRGPGRTMRPGPFLRSGALCGRGSRGVPFAAPRGSRLRPPGRPRVFPSEPNGAWAGAARPIGLLRFRGTAVLDLTIACCDIVTVVLGNGWAAQALTAIAGGWLHCLNGAKIFFHLPSFCLMKYGFVLFCNCGCS